MNPLCDKITDSELLIMQVLWEQGESMSLTALRKAVQERSGWEQSTVKTLIRRLCDKGALSQEKREVYYYAPTLSEQEYNAAATESFLHRIYRGSARKLVAALVEKNDLTETDVAELLELFRVEDKT